MKVNLIIDSSYLLYKNVFILKKFNRVKQDLFEVLKNDLSKITNSYPFNNVYFVSDSKYSTWRKMLYKDYKVREKDESIDWEFVFKVFDDFKDFVRTIKNIKLLELGGIEGDDFIAHIVRESNKNGYSNLIVASDRDLNQLIKFDLNKKFINIQWNYKLSDERLYLPENYQLILNEIYNNYNHDIFELDDSLEFVNFVYDLISKNKVKTVVDEEFIFCKIIQGDISDNIPSVVYVKDGKIDKDGRGIGKDGALTIYKLYKEIYPEPINIDSDDFAEKLSDVIIYHKKIKDANAKEIIKQNILFNKKMLILDPKYMPDNVFESMKSFFDDVDNRVIEYTPVNLDVNEDDDFFDVEEDLPEQFRMESDGEKFKPDSFWEL